MAWFDRMETKIPGHEHQWWRARVTTSRSTSRSTSHRPAIFNGHTVVTGYHRPADLSPHIFVGILLEFRDMRDAEQKRHDSVAGYRCSYRCLRLK